MKKCPYCAEEIKDEAIVCRFCGRDLVEKEPETPEESEGLSTSELEGILMHEVEKYTAQGWVVISRTGRMAQLKKPKEFNWIVFLALLFFGMFAFLLPTLIYLIYYAVKKEPVITINVTADGEMSLSGDVNQIKTAKPAIQMQEPSDDGEEAESESQEAQRSESGGSTNPLVIILIVIAAMGGLTFFCMLISTLLNSGA